jgi:hypothetical protein
VIYVELLVGSQFQTMSGCWSGAALWLGSQIVSNLSCRLCALLNSRSTGEDTYWISLAAASIRAEPRWAWRTMTRLVIHETQTVAGPSPPPTEVPQLDEGLWQAWIEKNERLDKVRFARRVKMIAILVLMFGVVALMRFVG